MLAGPPRRLVAEARSRIRVAAKRGLGGKLDSKMVTGSVG
jgi:hypothetical protein